MALGATPIDFAYAIHTDVGHRCIGARINGRLVPLDSELKSGDRVEIFTSKVEGAGPSRDWLQIVVTPRAQNKIRQWFSRSRREEAVETGREELVKYMRREGLPVQKLTNSPVLAKVAGRPQLRRPGGAAPGHRREPRVGPVGGPAPGPELRGGEHEEQLPTTVRRPARSRVQGSRRRPRRGPGRRHGAPGPVLHAGAGRRDRGLRHLRAGACRCTAPTAPTP